MVILIASALSAVSNRIALVMALLLGRTTLCVVGTGTVVVTNAETAFCCTPWLKERRQMSAVLEMPAINFIFSIRAIGQTDYIY